MDLPSNRWSLVTAYKEHSNEILSIICWEGRDFRFNHTDRKGCYFVIQDISP